LVAYILGQAMAVAFPPLEASRLVTSREGGSLVNGELVAAPVVAMERKSVIF
jgi:hypothetical protein